MEYESRAVTSGRLISAVGLTEDQMAKILCFQSHHVTLSGMAYSTAEYSGVFRLSFRRHWARWIT